MTKLCQNQPFAALKHTKQWEHGSIHLYHIYIYIDMYKQYIFSTHIITHITHIYIIIYIYTHIYDIIPKPIKRNHATSCNIHLFHPRQKKVPLLGAVDVPCPTSAPNPPTAAAALPFAPPPGKTPSSGGSLGISWVTLSILKHRVCLKMLCTPLYPMVLLIIIPTKWL